MATSDCTALKRCRKCDNEYPATDEYFQRNGEYLTSPCRNCKSESNKQYRGTHAEEIKANKKRWQQDNPEKVRAAGKRYRVRNADRVRELKRQSVQRNAETHKQSVRAWHVANMDKVRAKKHRRRALEKNASGSFTSSDIQLQYKAQSGKCWWCGKPLRGEFHIDHRIPLNKGGGNHAGNIVLAHAHCNQSKGAKLPWEWNGRLL